ncbi:MULTISPECIES: metal ABC transporter solute-binding protein, Zn/Mn family [Rhodococcus]|uniref:Zinc ABC transporter substrate-binding protein n=1 Tax=Rhodococcus oxybenzonivorans TaxID=1990687 RepID=A0AAE4V160_9NOCA|nr:MULTISPECIES: zinc ABC transporter substrate-binding protein [Rhodococcus]MDV7241279.1 zinc ABC transporter substrate-binding protein [Rhodococcus oxybenzonivorans]MDV7266194.1 zinc ABC transporter substrate-binding protein [Rhodococcus oxybenzonivorans]MDV7273552.1 zinc ABC transporter substrate-binding protein [Rhodococcus oxybenzonivorans]MDV7332710.1 zinc ABC transporter substrate-binding protein [Rhodococcus oxybenzonivorans]MDV7341876.1 zinc ABC transporter substrate-binding protein [
MRASSGFRVATAAVGLSFAAALTLTACSSDTSSNGALTVVASTNVWGSVAQAVAGDKVEVSSIITEPSSDPHSFEASPTDAAKLTDASLIVYNGGGYDHFVDDIINTGNGDQLSVNAFELFGAGAHAGEPAHEGEEAGHEGEEAGHEGDVHEHGEVNEHVWYDVATVDATAHAIAEKLGQLDPDNADVYTANAETFHGRLAEITVVTDGIAAAHKDAPIAQTEPIAHYLVESAELNDVTPADFTSAIENGNDPAPAAIAATRQLITDKQVKAVVYNTQTQDKVTEDVRATAEAAGVPVVEVTETLPEGLDYIQWQTNTAQALAKALQ